MIRMMLLMMWWWLCLLVGCRTDQDSTRAVCPPERDISPCSCDGPDRFLLLTCDRIEDQYSITMAASSFTRTRAGKFSLLNSRIKELESDLLRPIQFQYIFLRKNTLKVIGPEFFDSSRATLVRIEIVHNDLEKFPFQELASFPRLEFISLRYNAIDSIPDLAFGKEFNHRIRKIDLSFNKIKHVGSNAFKFLARLERLDLRHNKLTVVNNLAFAAAQPNPKLMLNLAGNKVMFVAEEAFENQVFKCLNLTDNTLTRLQEKAFRGVLRRMAERGTGVIAVADNRFRCTCDRVQWLVELPSHYKIPILDMECADRDGKSLQDLTLQELGC